MSLRRVSAIRFLTSLMEGGSRPALVKADDGELYVVKLRGAAQGVAPLASEIIVGELARRLGLPVPEIALVTLPADFSKGESDPELRELLKWSAGTNVGLRFVPEAIMFDPASVSTFDSLVADRIVWLDALTLNIDRTVTNPNLLQRGHELILIDHGAALYFHFNWAGLPGKSRLPFEAVRQHVLLRWTGDLAEASLRGPATLTPEVLGEIVGMVPDDLFAEDADGPSAADQRSLYIDFLQERVAASDVFEEEVRRAHANTL